MFDRTGAFPALRDAFGWNSLIGELLEGFQPTPPLPPYQPPVDVLRGETGLEVQLEVPGLDRESLDVTVERGVLTVSGQKATTPEADDHSYQRRERRRGTFRRTFRLPEDIHLDGIEASYTHGILRIVVPWAPRVLARKVPVQPA